MPQADGRPMPEGYRTRVEPGSVSMPGPPRWFEMVAEGNSGLGAEYGGSDGIADGPVLSPVTELRPRNRSAAPGSLPAHLCALIHDARNMVSVLELYCDLLEEPGVLSTPFHHYAGELRRIGAVNRRLLEGLSQLDNLGEASSYPPRLGRTPSALPPMARLRSRWQPDCKLSASPEGVPPQRDGAAGSWPESLARSGARRVFTSGTQVENLAGELNANRNLLAAMVGHAVTLEMTFRGGACPIAMTGDDLTRVLVNLARNAAEAMPEGGHLQIELEEGSEFLTLSFTDNGPGIPEHALESIFSPGYSTHFRLHPERNAPVGAWPVQHRGLGLSIVRSLTAAAGGAVWAANRMADTGSDPAERFATHGAVFLIEFPLPKASKGLREGPET